MNQNDMDRYFWRTGHRWSGDWRPRSMLLKQVFIPRRALFFIALFFVVPLVMLLPLRIGVL
jgi:hypothetical protein